MKRSAPFEWTRALEKELSDCPAHCDPSAASSALGPMEFHASSGTTDVDKDMAVDVGLEQFDSSSSAERGGTIMPKWPQGDGDSAAGPCLLTDRANKDDTLCLLDVISESAGEGDVQDATMSPVVYCHGSESALETSPAKIDVSDDEVSGSRSSASGHSSASFLTHRSHPAPADHVCPCCVSLGRCGVCLREIRSIRSSLKSPEGP